MAPGECFLAVGVWRPDKASLSHIRLGIANRPDRWRRARDDRKFRSRFRLEGGSLKSAPRGYASDHPLIEDLRRTDFAGVCELEEQEVLDKRFAHDVATAFAASRMAHLPSRSMSRLTARMLA